MTRGCVATGPHYVSFTAVNGILRVTQFKALDVQVKYLGSLTRCTIEAAVVPGPTKDRMMAIPKSHLCGCVYYWGTKKAKFRVE